MDFPCTSIVNTGDTKLPEICATPLLPCRAWVQSLTHDAVAAFLRGAALGVELREAWIVCCAAAYVWNYYNHALQENRHAELVNTMQALLDAFKQVGHAG